MIKNRLVRGFIVGCAVFLCILILDYLQLFRQLEWKSWDLRLQLFSSASRASEDIVLFFIDQDSLDVYEKEQGLTWPWPREIYSYLIDYLERGGAKALFIDLIFTESSSWGVEDDQKLSEAMAKSGNVFLPLYLSKEEKTVDEGSVPFMTKFTRQREDIPPKALFPAKSVSLPLESFMSSARGIGNVNFPLDSDAIYRRAPLIFSYNNFNLPGLPLAIVEFLKGKQDIVSIPLDDSGRMIIRFYGPTGTYKSYSVAAVINSFALVQEGKPPQIPPEEFKDKIVLLGGSAPGLLDLRSTPFSPVCPGVEILATIIDNLLHEDFVKVPSNGMFFLFLFFSALLGGIVTSLLKSTWKIAFFFFLCLGLPAGIVSLAFYSDYWLGFVAPEFAALFGFIGAALLNYSVEGRQRRFIKSVFRHYLNPHVIERILKNPNLLQLGGEKREISSFFSDVAGFTSISESLAPEDLVHLLNAYLSEMTDIILSTGGTLDKYEGDAIVAFWNAPLDRPHHAWRACQAALKGQKRLAELRDQFKKEYGHELSMRIGINTGPAVVGNMGSRNRFDYTAMGDTINLASRLEGACKQYKVSILIGEMTHEKAKENIVVREVDLIRVVGKTEPVRVFELVGERGEVSETDLERIKTFHQALELYKSRQWERAQNLFQKIENDMLAQMYVERCERLKKSPPPEDWTGIYQLKEK